MCMGLHPSNKISIKVHRQMNILRLVNVSKMVWLGGEAGWGKRDDPHFGPTD